MPLRPLLFGAALGLVLGIAPTAFAGDAPATGGAAVHRQAADAYRFPLGRLEITALSDGTVPQDLHALLTGTTPADVDALLDRAFVASPLEASINVFLISDGDRRILVDTGSGQLFGPGYGGKLVASLAAAGATPADITDILITHVHTDHTGGLVVDGSELFPNAVVHVGAPDLDFFLDPANAARTGYAPRYFEEAAKTIGVSAKSGKVKTFTDGETVLPGIVATLHPGHTPGSAFFTVSSEGRTIVFIGDIVHVAPVQFPRPEITIVYDLDPKQAAVVRETSFADFAETRQLIAAPHLPFPGVGHIRRETDGSFTWHPLEYRNRDGL